MASTYGPYTPVRRGGNLLFVSGQVGINPDTKTASANVTQQAEQALGNLASVLKEAGATLADVVKTTVFLTDMNDFTAVNAVYEQVFATPRPARSAVGVSALPRVAGEIPILVEIEAVAYKEAA